MLQMLLKPISLQLTLIIRSWEKICIVRSSQSCHCARYLFR